MCIGINNESLSRDGHCQVPINDNTSLFFQWNGRCTGTILVDHCGPAVLKNDWNGSNLRASHAIILYLGCKVTRVRAEDIACFIKCDAREKKK